MQIVFFVVLTIHPEWLDNPVRPSSQWPYLGNEYLQEFNFSNGLAGWNLRPASGGSASWAIYSSSPTLRYLESNSPARRRVVQFSETMSSSPVPETELYEAARYWSQEYK